MPGRASFAELVVDHQHFEAALVLDVDAQRPILVAVFEVLLPQVGRLQDVPVGVHGARMPDLVDLVHVALIALCRKFPLQGGAHDSPRSAIPCLHSRTKREAAS